MEKKYDNEFDSLSEDQKELVWRMFFGPYKDEWKNSEGIVINDDRTIARRVGANIHSVSHYIGYRLGKHFNHVKNKINESN